VCALPATLGRDSHEAAVVLDDPNVSRQHARIEVAGDETSEACAERLLQHGVVVAPGSYLGASGEGYVRIALVPTLEECERAAAILEDVL